MHIQITSRKHHVGGIGIPVVNLNLVTARRNGHIKMWRVARENPGGILATSSSSDNGGLSEIASWYHSKQTIPDGAFQELDSPGAIHPKTPQESSEIQG